nr:MAG TPA: hypothetical protein [Caudoviricetes sp.]
MVRECWLSMTADAKSIKSITKTGGSIRMT